MCDPGTITALAIASTVITAGAQVYSGMAANAQGKYEQQVMNQNARLERESVSDAQARQAIEQQRHWRRVAAAMGTQRAQAGALGLDVNFGSIGDLQEDTLMIGYEDASTINENFAKEIKGYDINASNYVMQGRAARSRGRQAMIGGFLSGAGTRLGGASQIGRLNASMSAPSGSSSNFSTGGYSNSIFAHGT
jgi:hypothetical protein